MDEQTPAEAREKAQYATFMKSFVAAAKARAPAASLNLAPVMMPDKDLDTPCSTFFIVGKTAKEANVFLSVRLASTLTYKRPWKPVLSVLTETYTTRELISTDAADLFHGEYQLGGVYEHWAGDVEGWKDYLVWLYFDQIDGAQKAKLDDKLAATREALEAAIELKSKHRPSFVPTLASSAMFCNAHPTLQTPLSIWQAFNKAEIDFDLKDDEIVAVIRYSCSKTFKNGYLPTAAVIREAAEQRTACGTIDSTSAWRQALFKDYERAALSARCRDRNARSAARRAARAAERRPGP